MKRSDLRSLLPFRMQNAINRLSRLLKPGGIMLLRDYGRYDMAQLRFKKGIFPHYNQNNGFALRIVSQISGIK